MEIGRMLSQVIIFAWLGLGAYLPAVAAAQAPAAALPADGCRRCHEDEKFRVQNKKLFDYFQEWKGSAHDRAGLSCAECHGGDPAADSMAEGHKGVLPRSQPESPFHFRNIPATCGRCHPGVLERFERSRHYEQMKASGRGPTCITCHGSLDARIYTTTIVERSCAQCHNPKTGNRPEVVAQAREILGRLNHANGYRRGLKFYYESIRKPEAMAEVDRAYEDIVRFWHEFDFKRLGPRSRELAAELKALYLSAQEDRKRAHPEAP